MFDQISLAPAGQRKGETRSPSLKKERVSRTKALRIRQDISYIPGDEMIVRELAFHQVVNLV
jgi:hypothetical protein